MIWQRAWIVAAMLAVAVSAHAAKLTGPVLWVVDGDTLVVLIDGKRERVRLRNVWAPELKEPGGPEATAALKAQCEGKTAQLVPHGRDKYRRLLADVTCEMK
jgi:micrococcal nuclease